MLRSLDIGPLFTTPPEQRPVGFYSHWRSYFYSNLDPSQFIIDSVELEGAALQAALDAVAVSTEESTAIIDAVDVAGADNIKPRASRGKKGTKSKGAVKVPKVQKKPKKVEFDPQTVVYWLDRAKDLLLASGGSLTPALVEKMVDFVQRAYSMSTQSRERAQLAYVLRTLGHQVDVGGEASEEIYAVLMEFDNGGGPTMVYASADSFSCSYWHRDARKWSVFDKGDGSQLSTRICKVAYEVLDKFPSGSQGEVDFEGGDLPLLPTTQSIRFSVISSAGTRTISVDKTMINEVGFEGLYNGFTTLFGVLVGKDFDHKKHGTSEFVGNLDVDEYPLKMDKSTLVPKLAPLTSRVIAFLFDMCIFSVVFGAFFYFISPMVGKWGLMPAATVYILLGFSLPLILAWMESSPDWGHATFGKKIVGAHVHGVNSPHISFAQALSRNMVKFVLGPVFLFSGYLWGALHPYRRCWHDLLADTVVINGPLRLGLLETYDEGGSLRGTSFPDKESKKPSPVGISGSSPSPKAGPGTVVSGDQPAGSKPSQLEYGFDE